MWCRLFCNIGYVWMFLKLQLIPLSILAPTQDTHRLKRSQLNRNYTVIDWDADQGVRQLDLVTINRISTAKMAFEFLHYFQFNTNLLANI